MLALVQVLDTEDEVVGELAVAVNAVRAARTILPHFDETSLSVDETRTSSALLAAVGGSGDRPEVLGMTNSRDGGISAAHVSTDQNTTGAPSTSKSLSRIEGKGESDPKGEIGKEIDHEIGTEIDKESGREAGGLPHAPRVSLTQHIFRTGQPSAGASDASSSCMATQAIAPSENGGTASNKCASHSVGASPADAHGAPRGSAGSARCNNSASPAS
eukprot:1235723-Pleurochrysis_carterae.AAC.2